VLHLHIHQLVESVQHQVLILQHGDSQFLYNNMSSAQ